MIKRRKTSTVTVGNVKIGHKHKIPIQSMTKVDTTNISACIRQIKKLEEVGCDIIRIAVPTKPAAEAFAKIVDQTNIPVVADIHFSHERAIDAIEAGAAKIRINPGNITERKNIIKVIDAAKMHGTAIRIGINEASVRDLKHDVSAAKRTTLMKNVMRKYLGIFEKQGFNNLVLSAKSADPIRTIEINRVLAANFEYPIHLGLTHAGLPEDAAIPSAVTLGALLAEGIGDTVRVSLAGDPCSEIIMAQEILTPLGLYASTKPILTVCPTCGRCQVNVVSLAKKIKKVLKNINKPIHVAVMGCIVNGPGEAADADIAVCAANKKGYIYREGKKIAVFPEERLLEELTKEINNS